MLGFIFTFATGFGLVASPLTFGLIPPLSDNAHTAQWWPFLLSLSALVFGLTGMAFNPELEKP